jgi:hypothetical protein
VIVILFVNYKKCEEAYKANDENTDENKKKENKKDTLNSCLTKCDRKLTY